MKKILSTLLLFIAFVSTNAQTDSVYTGKDTSGQKIKTVFGDPGRLGWWVAPEAGWTKFSGKDAFIMGLSSGIIVKHSFSIGLAGYGIINSNELGYSGVNDTVDVYLYGGYGGLKLEYRLCPLNMINVSFPLLIGAGGVVYSTWGNDEWNYDNDDMDDDYTYAWDSYFVVEPGVALGINILKFMRLDAGISYRFTSNVELPRTDGDLMNNLNGTMSLKFGRF